MKTVLWLLLSIGLSLAAPLIAQSASTSAEATYAKARLYETTERDLKNAMALYAQVANDTVASAELRSKAWLALGLVLDRLGQKEPALDALGKAAKGAGGAAAEAKARLAGQGPTDSHLILRVRALVDALKSPDEKIWQKARSELLWIGAPAVPAMVEAVTLAQLDLELVGRLVGTLLLLGGPPVEKFLDDVLRSPDVLLRRAVARGFSNRRDLAPATHEAMARFVGDADAGVRAEALQRVGHGVDLERLVGWCKDADAAVRRQAIRILAQRDDVTMTPEVLAVLRPQITDAKAEHHREACEILNRSSRLDLMLRSPEGRELFLDYLANVDQGQHYGFSSSPFDAAPTLERVITVARAIGPVQIGPDNFQTVGAFRQVMLMSFVDNCLPVWGATGVPVLCELTSLDYSWIRPDLWQRMQELARPDDLARMASLLPKSAGTNPATLATWIRERGAAKAAVAPLLAAIDALLAKPARNQLENNRLQTCVSAAAALRTRESMTAAARAAERVPTLWAQAAHDLQGWESPDQLEALAILVAIGEGQNAQLRGRFLWRLVKASHPDLARLMPRAYELGIQTESADMLVSRSNRGLVGLFGLDVNTNAHVHELGDDALAQILAACLIVTKNVEHPWDDLYVILRHDPRVYRVPPSAIAAACKSLDRCPDKKREDVMTAIMQARHGITPEVEALIEANLGHAGVARRVRAVNAVGRNHPKAIAWLSRALQDADGTVREQALARLGEMAAAEAPARAAGMLADSDEDVRRVAVQTLMRASAAGEIERVLPLLRDPDNDVQIAAINACKTWLDVRATEALLGALRDDTEAVRKAAREALDAIRYYHEQQAHWQKWLQSKGATSPADALLKQCAAGEPKKVRLAAIAALGTLGDPQALPFLIEMMKESDAEIAAAADAAVQKLNAKK